MVKAASIGSHGCNGTVSPLQEPRDLTNIGMGDGGIAQYLPCEKVHRMRRQRNVGTEHVLLEEDNAEVEEGKEHRKLHGVGSGELQRCMGWMDPFGRPK